MLIFLPYVVMVAIAIVASMSEEGGMLHPVLVVFALALLGASFAAPILYRRWLLRYIDPDPDIRAKVMRVYLFSVGGSSLAVGELLDHSVLRGGGTPLWYQKRRKK